MASIPVVVYPGGREFPSVTAACTALGLKPGTVYTAMLDGHSVKGYTIDPVNPDQFERPRRPAPGRAVRCVETGETFPSVRAAARWAGLRTHAPILQALRCNYRSAGYRWAWEEA